MSKDTKGKISGTKRHDFLGAPMGMNQLDPTIGGLLKNLGYAARPLQARRQRVYRRA